MKKNVVRVVIGILVLGFVCVAGYKVLKDMQILPEKRTDIVNSIREDVVSDLSVIQEKCSHIATTVYTGNSTVDAEVSKDFLWWKGSRKIWIEFPANVVTGIDASKIQQSINGNALTITIPRSMILSAKCDEEGLSAEGYFIEKKTIKNWWVKISAEKQTEILGRGESQVSDRVASDRGLMEQSQLEAKQIIQKYIDTINAQRNVPYKVVWRML